jgi:hypothetical protein
VAFPLDSPSAESQSRAVGWFPIREDDLEAVVALVCGLALEPEPAADEPSGGADAPGTGDSLRALVAKIAGGETAGPGRRQFLPAFSAEGDRGIDDVPLLVLLVYRRLLDREPTDEEAESWRTALEEGCGVRRFIVSVAASSETGRRPVTLSGVGRGLPERTRLVNESFQAVVDLASWHYGYMRSAAAGGVRMRQFESGDWRRDAALDQKLRECFLVNGEEIAKLVVFVYMLFLGRGPDAEGLRVYVAGLRGGLSPLAFIEEIMNSSEARGRVRSLA